MYSAIFYQGHKPKGQEIEISISSFGIKLFRDGNAVENWNFDELKLDPNNEDGHWIISKKEVGASSYLEIKDQQCIDQIKAYLPSQLKRKSTPSKWSTASLLLVFTGVLIAVVGLLYFVFLPKISYAAVALIPKEAETTIGESGLKSMLPSHDEDTLKSRLLQEFFSKLKINSEYKIQMHCHKDQVVNAFALPGGPIVVYDGIIQKMTHYSQLVALLGHEYTHIEKRHSLKSIAQSLASYGLVSLLVGDVSAVVAVIAENVNSIQNLSYSRDFETESDVNALEILKNNKVDPKGMLNLFAILEAEHEGAQIPKFMSTHPMTEDRMSLIQSKMKKMEIEFEENPELESLFCQLIGE
ncbi:MAG TPA: M48 family metallopeptidase [Saprospiraceae bacterium]|nr:M48 family metallopeptidase [Saprospiraceae bacterium]